MDFDLPTLLDEDPTDEEQQTALLAALRQQQEQQQENRASLQNALGRQQGQAGALRSLALLSSLGNNSLTQRMQQEASHQGGQLEGLAARTEQRLSAANAGALNPLRLLALKLQAEKEKRLAGDAKTREERLAEQLSFQKDKAVRGAAAAATKAGEKADSDAIKLERGLSKELQALPAYKNYQAASVAFDQVVRASKDPSPAGDIALITNYMRSLDPATGVKEQEFQNAQSAGGFDDRARAGWERIMSGQRLTPQQRADFVRSAKQNTLAFKTPYDQALKHYEGLSTSYKVNPKRVAMPAGLDLSDEPSEAPPAAVPAPPTTPKPAVHPRDYARTFTNADGVMFGQRKDGSVVRINKDGTQTPVTVRK